MQAAVASHFREPKKGVRNDGQSGAHRALIPAALFCSYCTGEGTESLRHWLKFTQYLNSDLQDPIPGGLVLDAAQGGVSFHLRPLLFFRRRGDQHGLTEGIGSNLLASSLRRPSLMTGVLSQFWVGRSAVTCQEHSVPAIPQ